MTPQTFDLIVVGAGPAGASAALAAAAHGMRVVLLDEAEEAGGQIYRSPAPLKLARDDPDLLAGDVLRRRLAESNVTWAAGARVWTVGGRCRVDAVSAQGHQAFEAPRLIAATGAHERVVPFPGWTLPGVMGLAAATILLKSQAMLPGHRVIVAGCGPLLAAVAGKIVRLGGRVVAVVDLASAGEWLRAVPALLRRPELFRRGVGWTLAIKRHHVPIYFAHGIRRAEGGGKLARVIVAPVDREGALRPGGTERVFDSDALAVGHGLVPGGEIPRLYGARQTFDPVSGWTVERDAHGRTSISSLYAAGDGAGVRGAEAAHVGGELAGLAAAIDAGVLSAAIHDQLAQPLLRHAAKLTPFTDAIGRLMALRPGQIAAIPRYTVVCRCEDITRGCIEDAVDAGARDVNQMKHFTRCGMGPCQGRMCGDVAAELVALRTGASRETVGYWTGRPPLRPVHLDSLLGDFAYTDIPLSRPAPL